MMLMQAVASIILGSVFVAAPPATITGVTIALGTYWLVRGLAMMAHSHVDPGHWMSKGLVTVLGIATGVLVLQAPVLGLVPIGMVVILFVAIQALVTGGIEMALGIRQGIHSLAILGLISVVLGAVLAFHFVFPIEALPMAMGAVALVGGFLSAYAAIRLPDSTKTALSGITATLLCRG